MTIIEFLEARIAEDEAIALAAIGPRGNISSPDGRWRFIDAGYNGTWPRTVELGYDDPEDIVWAKEGWAVHASRHDPARVLRDCIAKRAIIGYHKTFDYLDGPICTECGDADDSPMEFPCPTVKALAAVYSDHPAYQQEWKP